MLARRSRGHTFPPPMSSTEKRRRTILEVIEAAPVRSQAELLALLESKGIAATQPQLSRDLREIGRAHV